MTRPTMPMPLVQKVRVKAHKCCGVAPIVDEIETAENTLCVIRCPKCLRRHTGTYGTAFYNWNYDIAVSALGERERKAAEKSASVEAKADAEKPIPMEVKPVLKEIKMPKKPARKAVKKGAKKAKNAVKKSVKKAAKKVKKAIKKPLTRTACGRKKKGKKR